MWLSFTEGLGFGQQNFYPTHSGADGYSRKRPIQSQVPGVESSEVNIGDFVDFENFSVARTSSDSAKPVLPSPTRPNPSPVSSNPDGVAGRIGEYRKSFTASNGKSSEFLIEVPPGIRQKKYGLLVYVHGDTAVDYTGQWQTVKRMARKYGLVALSVKSPSRSREQGTSWWMDADKNADYLNELLQKEVLGKYNIDKNRTVFTGQSGGPTFLTGPWIKRYASQFRGGALLLCGSRVRTNFTPRNWTPDFLNNFKMVFVNGRQDFLYDLARAAARDYRASGFNVETDFSGNYGHCAFRNGVQYEMDRGLASILGSSRSSLVASR